LATAIKEWGLKLAIGLGTLPAEKFTPFFFQQINNNKQRKEKVAKRKESQPHTTIFCKFLLISGTNLKVGGSKFIVKYSLFPKSLITFPSTAVPSHIFPPLSGRYSLIHWWPNAT
jgi:hypothetical protein